ncbi:MAG TPA: ammonium transporter, partial [Tepidisphaeraceae bacterium]|nr:ammonium transporter [Tepidisphaeraceae bacterium]
ADEANVVTPVKIGDVKEINSGDTAWMLTSAALVLMMTGPGLALFYGGLVRRKNVLGTMMHSFILMAAVSVAWAIVGYSLAFDVGTPFIGGLRFAFLRGVGAAPCEYAPTIPHTTWMVYQAMFAVITPALICGAYAERMKFKSMLLFSMIWLLVIYCPMAHMVWGKGGLLNAWTGGRFPALDFAGGTVVHISSGVSALVCALVLGKRKGYGESSMPPHSVVLSAVGAALLWVGWFGFNAGSALSASGLASGAFVATHLSAAAAALGWAGFEWIKNGKATVLGAISGAVAGLVVITPASGYTTPMYAIIMGAIGGIVCAVASTELKHKFGYDDSLDAFGVHGTGGALGALLTGVFAVAAVNLPPAYAPKAGEVAKLGLIEGNYAVMLNQIIAIAITCLIAIVGSLIILKVVDLLMGLRISDGEESQGLDLSQHGEAGYIFEEGAAGKILHEGVAPSSAGDEPRPASQPPNGQRRFSVVIDGVNNADLIRAWSALCQVGAAPPVQEFKAVYPYLTTVQGNRFQFRGGDPNIIRENIARLFQNTLNNSAIHARVETN